MSFWAELRRRNVIRMAGLYLVGAWLVAQVAETLLPIFETPDWVLKVIVVLLAIGFVPALVFAWVFELTPEGLRRDAGAAAANPIAPATGRRMDRMIVLGLLAVIAVMVAERYWSPAAVPDAAPAPEAAVAAAPDKSIAVLPFESLSEEKANAYFAGGIQDQILTGLSRIAELKVVSRTSTLRYGSSPENLTQIARELGVAHILEGSVQRAGNHVRINVQLIAADSDTHLWAETYDRTLDDVFAVQSEVAEKVAASLRARLTAGERADLTQKPTDDPEAYQAYLKARAQESAELISTAQSERLLDAYREAVRRDPGFAQAWADLARAAVLSYWLGFDPDEKLPAEARVALDHAIALAPEAIKTRLAQGAYQYYVERDFAGALASIEAVKAASPGNADAWFFAGLLNRRLGNWEASVRNFQQAQGLEPNTPGNPQNLAVSYYFMGDCPRAVASATLSLAINPDNPTVESLRLTCAWITGDLDEADRLLAAMDPDAAPTLSMKAWQAGYRGDYAGGLRLLDAANQADSELQFGYNFAGYIPARIEWGLQKALLERRRGNEPAARATYAAVRDEVRTRLEATLSNANVEAALHSALGMALAGLGEVEAGVAEGRRATALVPLSEDHFEGVMWVGYLAQVHALGGDAAGLVAPLREALATHYFSPAWVRLDPVFDEVRDDPAIQALLAEFDTAP